MSRRRFLLAAAAVSTLWFSACSQAAPTPIHVTQTQLEQGLSAHFPKQYPIAGLLQLQVAQPLLHMLPTSNQIQTVLNVELTGPVLGQPLQGQMQVRLGLYYEPRDRSLRAERVEVLELTLTGADPALADMVKTYDRRVAQQALQGFALYSVPAENVALAERLGWQPGAITVTEQGLEIAFVNPDGSTAPTS